MESERLNEKFLEQFKEYNFTKIREEKIFLVGSIRFKDFFIEIESILQINYSKLVSICSVDGLLNKEKFSKVEWDKLQKVAIRKLKQHEAILVLDVNHYIGDETIEEIEYFRSELRRPIYYLTELRFNINNNNNH